MKLTTDLLKSKHINETRKQEGFSDTDSETIISSEVLGLEGLEFETLYQNDVIKCPEHVFIEDPTMRAGKRLYYQALDQQQRLKDLRKEAITVRAELTLATKTPMGQKLRSIVSKKNQELLKNRPLKKAPELKTVGKVLDLEMLKSAPVPERCNQLYQLSHHDQAMGKIRRNLIKEKKTKFVPERKVLPASRSGDMYSRSMERLIAHKLKLAAKADEMGTQS